MTNPLSVAVNATPVLAEIVALDYGQGLGDRAEPRDRAGAGGGGGSGLTEDFGSVAIGALPDGWVEFARSGGLNMRVREVAGSLSGRAMVAQQTSGRNVYGYAALPFGSHAVGQILAITRWLGGIAGVGASRPNFGPSFNVRANARDGIGAGQNENGTFVGFSGASGSWNVAGTTGGQTAWRTSIGLPPAAGTRMFQRIIFDIPNNVYRFKTWVVGTSEPGWLIDIVNSALTSNSRNAAGPERYIGVSYNTGGSSAEDWVLEYLGFQADITTFMPLPGGIGGGL